MNHLGTDGNSWILFLCFDRREKVERCVFLCRDVSVVVEGVGRRKMRVMWLRAGKMRVVCAENNREDEGEIKSGIPSEKDFWAECVNPKKGVGFFSVVLRGKEDCESRFSVFEEFSMCQDYDEIVWEGSREKGGVLCVVRSSVMERKNGGEELGPERGSVAKESGSTSGCK
ncbi:hypothetical protein COLO4_22576 [Corchorus olitorius]|uniref:Uncharacterized protein n=1 Tax=Corchorus olitorius TaxID=93759 RepID=A0A1R3ILC3_9ROSI|nr:hypothetical protein COLO4_22576 [Corchorus olitorius]